MILSLTEAHSSLGHISMSTIRKMVERGAVEGLQLLSHSDEEKNVRPSCRCRACIEANLRRADVPKMRTRLITRPLQLVGSDVQTMEVRSYDGKLYFVIYVCQGSNFTASVSLARKSLGFRVSLARKSDSLLFRVARVAVWSPLSILIYYFMHCTGGGFTRPKSKEVMRGPFRGTMEMDARFSCKVK